MERNKIEENYERYMDIIYDIQKLVRKYEDLYMLVPEDRTGLKDGVVYLFFPQEATVVKSIMLRIYSVVFAADETHISTSGSKRSYLAFVVNDIFEDGVPIEDLDEI